MNNQQYICWRSQELLVHLIHIYSSIEDFLNLKNVKISISTVAYIFEILHYVNNRTYNIEKDT